MKRTMLVISVILCIGCMGCSATLTQPLMPEYTSYYDVENCYLPDQYEITIPLIAANEMSIYNFGFEETHSMIIGPLTYAEHSDVYYFSFFIDKDGKSQTIDIIGRAYVGQGGFAYVSAEGIESDFFVKIGEADSVSFILNKETYILDYNKSKSIQNYINVYLQNQ